MPSTFIYPSIPEASRLQSIRGIEVDMRQLDEYCHILANLLKTHEGSGALWEAVSSAAVVRYARCFHSGVRERLNSEPLGVLSSELRFAHQYIYDIRDKYIAHSVSGYEENLLRATVNLVGEVYADVFSVDVVSKRILAFSSSDLPYLTALVAWWLEWLDEERRKEESIVMKRLNEMDRKQFERWRRSPEPSFLAPGAHKTRRRAP